MKKITLLTTLCCLLLAFSLKSQWQDETNFNQVVHGLKGFNNELFVGGNFTKRESQKCYWSTRFDGSSFTNQTTLLGGGGFSNFEIYNGELYATGALDMSAVVKWTGSGWTAVGPFYSSHSGIFADGNDLYVGSDFGVVSKKTGAGSFTAMPVMDDGNDDISAINKYNGEIIIAGKLHDFNSVALNNIARWDGSGWQSLGLGVSSGVNCMAIYNSELYVAGYFSSAGGQAAKHIAKWNGTSWSDVGGSVSGSSGTGIRDMLVYNNMLFVVGNFTEIGGVATNKVAMWDGTSWHSLDLTTTSSAASAVEVFNNRLYVGTFDFTESHLYSRDLSAVGTDDIKSEDAALNVHPNPSSGTFYVQLKEGEATATIDVVDALGNTVLTQESNSQNVIMIDIQDQPKGIYFFKVISRNKMEIKKVILN